MFKSTKDSLRKFINKFGYEIVKLENHIEHGRRGSWLEKLDIKTIIDIGSNRGQFINQISKLLPGRKIYAFEPIKECYDALLINTKKFDVTAHNTALGNINGESEINVSSNFVSSSILKMEEVHNTQYPDSNYVKKETIKISRLDDVMKQYNVAKNVLIKIDVQGYEEQVLSGGHDTVESGIAVVIETAIKPMYEGQWMFDQVYQYFTSKGYVFMGFSDQIIMKTTGIPLYADSIYIKKEFIDKVY